MVMLRQHLVWVKLCVTKGYHLSVESRSEVGGLCHKLCNKYSISCSRCNIECNLCRLKNRMKLC
jgi:hypothetical protein